MGVGRRGRGGRGERRKGRQSRALRRVGGLWAWGSLTRRPWWDGRRGRWLRWGIRRGGGRELIDTLTVKG